MEQAQATTRDPAPILIGDAVKTLLQLKTSLFSDHGESSRLTNRFVEHWRTANPGGSVIVRDLALEPVPHLDAAGFKAFLAKPAERTAEQARVVSYSDALIEELQLADEVVIGLPMYNFGVPSTLKAYIDHIARAGVTFRYTQTGPIGLLTGKKVHVFAARGGRYVGTPLDTESGYFSDVLRFLGLTEVEFVYAEGLALGETVKAQSLATAHAKIDGRASPLTAAA
jgi:FMN-dependent NADH-azoreductase